VTLAHPGADEWSRASAPIGSSALIVLSRQWFGASPVVASYVRRVRRGASPGDGVFVPVSPACLLTRPNRMTVSPGTRAGATTIHRIYCPFWCEVASADEVAASHERGIDVAYPSRASRRFVRGLCRLKPVGLIAR
jgi:hypothetical protein